MRRLLPLVLLCALAAACGGGGTSAADAYAQAQTQACAKVQRTVAAIRRPKVGARTPAGRARESLALSRYAIAIDRALIRGMPTLRAVQPPSKLVQDQRSWLVAVRRALRARLGLDTAPPARLQKASKVELRTRRAANALAGTLGIASGCTLTY
jgi:hypothetical protein